MCKKILLCTFYVSVITMDNGAKQYVVLNHTETLEKSFQKIYYIVTVQKKQDNSACFATETFIHTAQLTNIWPFKGSQRWVFICVRQDKPVTPEL